ncbi:PHP domain-like protein [Tuber magnatum]|uniref:PHP domain-like protein n=1 Tax=Tuber magnatum TaxID=42249 RepID=A0A317SGH6_9PEZI|nr:PHP domain-like protein [Tuber magnatum]
MFYDLNVPWAPTSPDLPRTVAFLNELGYNVIALSHTHSGKFPQSQLNPIPENPFPKHPDLQILRRITIILDDPSQNHRLAALTSAYDIVALRPTSEKLLLQACKELDCDLISVDLSQRMGYHFKHKTVGLAIQRGIFLEINYSASINDITARRNLIGNAAALIRATRGRGIVISSEARRALGVRGPFDVINLATLWGLSQDRGREAVDGLPRLLVAQAKLRRTSFRGVVDVVNEPPQGSKRKAEDEASRPDRPKSEASPEDSKKTEAPPKLSKKARRALARASKS